MAAVQSIYLDTNTIIAMVEGPEAVGRELHGFLETSAANGSATFHISALCLAELLVIPYRKKNIALTKDYLELATKISGLTTYPVSSVILDTAAVLRASISRLKLPDAIHLATASIARCQYFFTYDRDFSDLPEILHPVFSDVTVAPVKILRPDAASLAELSKAPS